MIILVDGYNVLKQLYGGQIISEQQRCSFIKQLAAYKKVRSHKKIIVIFDGGPDQWPSEEKIRGISVVYAGALQTADEYIYSFLKDHKAKATNMVLVSSDRQLCEWASDYGVVSIDAQEFYMLVQQALKPPVKSFKSQQIVKMSENSLPELDALMWEATAQVVPKQEDWLPGEREAKQRKLSKRERALLEKVKKL